VTDEVTLFRLLPKHIRGGDPDGVLQTLCDAVQSEYERMRAETFGLAVLTDVDRVNQDYFFVGSPPEASTEPNKIKLPLSASDLDGYYDGKWVALFGGTGSIPTRRRRIIAYDGAAREATVNEDWGIAELHVEDEHQVRTSGSPNDGSFTSVAAHGGIVPGSVVVRTAGFFPATPLLTGADDGNGIITGTVYTGGGIEFTGTIDYETGALTLLRSLGGDLNDTFTRISYAYRAPVLPDTTTVFGLLHVYVGLEYIARMVGYVPDAGEPDVLVREQTKNTIDISKLRGTRSGFELFIKTLGFDSSIIEMKQNYVHAPEDEPGIADPDYQPTRVQTGPVYVPREGGEDEVTEFLAANPAVTVQSSDIEVYVSRRHPDLIVSAALLDKLKTKLDATRPIHVEIILVGFVEDTVERLAIEDELLVLLTGLSEEALEVDDTLTVQVGGYLRIAEDLLVSDELEIVGAARWDHLDKRWDKKQTRWDLGTTYFRG
jgi:hypothetical protein